MLFRHSCLVVATKLCSIVLEIPESNTPHHSPFSLLPLQVLTNEKRGGLNGEIAAFNMCAMIKILNSVIIKRNYTSNTVKG